MGFPHRRTAATGLALVGLSGYLATLGDLTRAIPVFLAVFAAMYASYVLAVRWLWRAARDRRAALYLVFAVAVTCRLALLMTAPSLSDDAYRYLWEGRVVGAGKSPYAHAPASPELEFLRDASYERINHKQLPTIYPPLAQAAFYLGASVHPSVQYQKALFVLFDLGTMALLALFLRARGGNPVLCAVYGWNPLVIVEFSHSGHMDSLAIFFLVLAIYMFEWRRAVWGFLGMSLSFLAKYLSIVLLPFVLFKRRHLPWAVLFVLVSVIGYLPFAGTNAGLSGSLADYGRHWHFNSLLFEVVRGLLGDSAWIRVAIGVGLIAVVCSLGYRTRDLLRHAYLSVGSALLLSPTVHPWYLCWIVPFLCFYTSRAWFYLVGAVALSYTVWPRFHETGEWRAAWGVMLLEYAPFLALLVHGAYRAMKKGEGTS